jgi:RNA polymerase sigma factor (sigma-70 family)
MTDDAILRGRRPSDEGGMEDHRLLGRYAAARDEAAFTELVRRHLGFVYHAALRQCGGDAYRAEDVAQAVFTDLARKAEQLARRPVLAGWLYTSTRYAAAQAVRGEARRQAREREAQAMNEILSDPDAASAAEWERLRPAIDDALHALSERDREAVLLRFFEGRAFANVGRKLLLSEDAARMRVERALEKMRTVLARHGVTSTSAALATALASQAAATAPAGLAVSIAGSAMSGAAVAGAGSLAAVIAFMSASKITVCLAVAGALALGTAIYQSSQARTATGMLADASRDHAALIARLSSLDGRVKAAEQALADRAAALARQSAAKAAAPAAAELSPEALAALAQKAKYDETLSALRRSDPEYRKADSAKTRLLYREEFGPLFRTMGFTPEQIGQVCDFWVGQFNQRLDGGPGIGKTYHDNAADFWAQFGPDVPGRIAQFQDTRDARNLVLGLSARMYFSDEPFSPQQAEQLVKIVAQARPADANARPAAAPRPREWSDGLNYYGVAFRRQLDWDAILTQAGPVLSPAQLAGLRGLAAQARAEALLAAAEKESAAPMK